MPERMGIRELRDTLTATIRRVRGGATIEITHHGRPVATLAPARHDRIEQLLEAGDITPGEPLERPLRRFPVTTGVTASHALEEDRAER
jgi:prevent-host-death family protein